MRAPASAWFSKPRCSSSTSVALDPAPACGGLDNGLDRRGVADAMALERPPGGEARGEDLERALLRRLNGDAAVDGGEGCLGHRSSFSTAILKAARAFCQSVSKYVRTASIPVGSSW